MVPDQIGLGVERSQILLNDIHGDVFLWRARPGSGQRSEGPVRFESEGRASIAGSLLELVGLTKSNYHFLYWGEVPCLSQGWKKSDVGAGRPHLGSLLTVPPGDFILSIHKESKIYRDT